MRILAIDASINNIGWAVLESSEDVDKGHGLIASGTLRTRQKGDSERVFEIRDMLRELIKRNNQDFPKTPPIVDVDPAEKPYSEQNAAMLEERRIIIAMIEKPTGFTYGKHVSKRSGKAMTKQSMGQNNFAVGIIAASLAEHVDTIEFVSAQEWKGSQRKSITRMIVNNQFGLKLEDKNNDESDAIGIGCWKIRQMKLQKMIDEQEPVK